MPCGKAADTLVRYPIICLPGCCAPSVLRRPMLPASGVAEKVTGGIPAVQRERETAPALTLGHVRVGNARPRLNLPGERRNPMLENDLTLAAMAEALAKSADYRVLRRLVRREAFAPPSAKARR